MKCDKCGFENKSGAKFCTKCGNSLVEEKSVTTQPSSSNNSKFVIIGLVIVIIALVSAIGYFTLNSNMLQSDVDSQQASEDVSEVDNSQSSDEDNSPQTQEVASSKTTKSKSWESIGKYSGSGSGSETIVVPEGKIKVKLSAYPIKNYASNHLYVSGSNGESGGVDWGSKSPVETRSDSFKYSSSSEETFTIDYYETVSWEVEFFRYQ